MAIDAIGATGASSIPQRASIDQEDFLQVLLAQLRFQDPLEPLDNSEFIAQFAQLTNLEQTQQLNDKLETLLMMQNGAQAINLIGKTVEVATNTGVLVGDVTAIAMQKGTPAMTIHTLEGDYISDITLGQVRIIR